MKTFAFLYAFFVIASPDVKSQTAGQSSQPLPTIRCEGDYRHHLQGVCFDSKGDIYWSFTTALVKTDSTGKKIKQVEVVYHHGDLCYVGDRIYIAVNLGPFNHPDGKADSWVYVYDRDLKFLSKHRTPEVIYGAGGMDSDRGRFFVIGGLPESHQQNYVYEYDREFKFIKRHEISSGQTRLGIQAAALIDNQWWFGCYGSPRETLRTDANFKMLDRYEFDCAYGIAADPAGRIYTATGPPSDTSDKRWLGALHLTKKDSKLRLKRKTK
ncbi:MAG: hypothetical protein CMO80_24950 [Verrucomicrobiales bacterium]|mgnify:CR=1 FL=1|nr:hypothetical protein [Verrucomicrobiales bacterium]|tara:strand:+ start:5626 stop:6429 length:804 start_codon:yes stop_codon:yes gene_type:complete